MKIKPRNAFVLALIGSWGAWAAEGANASLDASNSSLVPPFMAVAVNAREVQSSRDGLYGTIGACTLVVKSLSTRVAGLIPSSSNILRPGDSALQIFEPYAPSPTPEDELYTSEAVHDEASHSSKTMVLEQPKHGRLVWLGDKGSEINLGNTNSYAYEPQNGYVGKDKATFMTELAGRKIKVVNYIRVTDKIVDVDDYQKLYEKYCPRRTWPIQSALTIEGNLTTWQRG